MDNVFYTHESRQLSRMLEILRKQHPVVRPAIVANEPSEDYPLGGSVEPYDIAMEKELVAE